MKRKKIPISDLIYFFIIPILFAPVLFSSLLTIVIKSVTIRIALSFMALALFFFVLSIRKNATGLPLPQTKPMAMNWLLLCMIGIISIGYLIQKDTEYEAIIRYIVLLIFFIFAGKDLRWTQWLYRYLFAASIFYILSTYFMKIDRNFYFNKIIPLYTESRMSLWYNEGFMTGVTDHYSTNGMVLANGTILFLSIFVIKSKKKINLKFGILTVLAVVALLLTGKRAHLLFTGLAFIFGFYLYKKNENLHFFKFVFFLVLMFLGVVVAYMVSPMVANVINRFSDIQEDTNILTRLTFWQAALASFHDHVLAGIGWFGFRNEIAPFLNYSGHAHNVYIQLLCETGLLGFTVFFTWMIASLIMGIKAMFWVINPKRSASESLNVIVLFSVIFQMYFLMYCVTGNPLYDAYEYPLYFVACIIPMYILRNKDKPLYL